MSDHYQEHPDGGHAAALGSLLGVSVACLPLHDGVQLYCDRDGLLLGLTLAHRARATSPAGKLLVELVPPPPGEVIVSQENAARFRAWLAG